MSVLQRFKAYVKARKDKKKSPRLSITVYTFTDDVTDTKVTSNKVVQDVNPIGLEAAHVLPHFLTVAIHDPEVLSLRASLGLPLCDGDDVMTPSTGRSSGRSLFITNPSPTQSCSTPATSLRSSIGRRSPSFSSAATRVDRATFSLTDFINIRGIGEGGFGAVYLVKHQPTGIRVALKAIDKRFCDHKAVEDEQRALRQVGIHGTKGIMEFLGSFHNSRHYFFITSYYPRGDLKAEIARWGRLPAKLVQFYAAELLLSIQAVHAHGLVHRDIKPDNIFLADDGHLVLGDFGLAASIVPPGERYEPGAESRYFLRDFAGTLHYLSPEMWKDEPYGFSVDVWAYTIVVFEMLFGRTPWQGSFEDDDSVMENRMVNATLDEWLGAERPDKTTRLFLQGMLDRDPLDRPTLQEARTHPFFKGISWEKFAAREILPPDVGNPGVTRPLESPEADIFFGSFGGGGVYLPNQDPLPAFNYMSPAFMTSHDRDINFISSALTSFSSTSCFMDISLSDNHTEGSTTAIGPCNLLSTPSCNDGPIPTLPPLSFAVSTTVTVTANVDQALSCSMNHKKVKQCSDMERDKIVESSTRVDIAFQCKPLPVLTQLRAWISSMLGGLCRACRFLPLRH